MKLEPVLEQAIVNGVKGALEEDIGSGDITALLVPETNSSAATIISREKAVICGIPWVNEVFRQLDSSIVLDWAVTDGDDIKENQTLCRLQGNSRHLLTGERTALNFLQTLSGTATVAREYAKLVEGTDIRILDTRKTIPGLRLAQKYAVRVGGCHNHRMGLYDAFLIKENHIAASGGIAKAVANARRIAPGKSVEVEVETLSEVEQAIAAKADRIMLDNFSSVQTEKAIQFRNQNEIYPNVEIEVSGNITVDGIAKLQDIIADFISTGAITKHCKAVDYSMRFQ